MSVDPHHLAAFRGILRATGPRAAAWVAAKAGLSQQHGARQIKAMLDAGHLREHFALCDRARVRFIALAEDRNPDWAQAIAHHNESAARDRAATLAALEALTPPAPKPLPPLPPQPHPTRAMPLRLIEQRQRASRRAASEFARQVEAGGMMWTIAPVSGLRRIWEIVESACPEDHRIDGEDVCRRRLERLAREGRLPPRKEAA